jgi:hypothetical protein
MTAQLAEIVWESPQKHLRIGWYDAEQSILVLQVLGRWTWEDAVHSIVRVLNPIIAAKAPQPIYTIISHDRFVKFMPRGGNAISALRQVLQTDPPNEVLAIFIRQTDVIRSLLEAVVRISRFADKRDKYRFVNTFDEALACVAAHKAQMARSQQA